MAVTQNVGTTLAVAQDRTGASPAPTRNPTKLHSS